ncbi:MAG: multiheme c-type cytochrome, partial [Bryobacteraceae bacterium]
MNRRLTLLCALSAAILLVNSALLWAFPTATAFNVVNLLLHVALGAVVGIVALILSRTQPRLMWMLAAAASGVVLAVIGNTRDHKIILLIHVVISLAAVAILFARKQHLQLAAVSAAAAALALIAGICYRVVLPHPEDHIVNSRTVPLSMYQEGAGPSSPFFPSAAKTTDDRLVPSAFFMESKKCGECHRDIYDQWKSSAHHFASFNNQFYRKSIEYMQSVIGTKPSKWCAGCHDHAV